MGQSTEGTETFRSAIDWWLAILLFGLVAAVPLFILVVNILNWPGWGEALLSLALGLIAPAIVVLLAWPIRYMLTDGDLVIRAGLLLRWTVPLAGITAVSPTRNPLSSPALSLRRLRVEYRTGNGGRREVMISPERRETFLDAIATRTGRLRREGERLVAMD